LVYDESRRLKAIEQQRQNQCVSVTLRILRGCSVS
jgi:hypothetical protein